MNEGTEGAIEAAAARAVAFAVAFTVTVALLGTGANFRL